MIDRIKSVCFGGGIGMISGYSYNKYRKMTSIGIGMGFMATQMRGRITKLLDLNKDGKVDDEDVKIFEEKTGLDIDLTACVSFVGGFGVGYVIGIIY